MAVNIPPAANKLRRLMNLGQFVQSHALSFFHLERAGFPARLGHPARATQRLRPDRLQSRTSPAPASACANSARRSLRFSAAKKSIRPGPCPAACATPLTEEGRARIRARLPEAFATTKVALDLFEKTMKTHKREIQIFGNFPSLFMGLVTPGRHVGTP